MAIKIQPRDNGTPSPFVLMLHVRAPMLYFPVLKQVKPGLQLPAATKVPIFGP